VAPRSCHERALGLLAVRSRSRSELQSRLRAAGFGAEEVAGELNRLEDVGLIDDLAFARAMASYQFGARRAGRRAVTSALLAKGVAPTVAAAVIEDADLDEDTRALELARSRATRMSDLSDARAFGRLTSLLQRRGYAPDVARRAARRALGVEGEE
jgi:regulatory protein